MTQHLNNKRKVSTKNTNPEPRFRVKNLAFDNEQVHDSLVFASRMFVNTGFVYSLLPLPIGTIFRTLSPKVDFFLRPHSI